VAALSLLYWELATHLLDVGEAWDSPAYSVAYLIALAASGAIGFLMPEQPWRWGLIVTFAQVPVIMLNAGAGPLLAVGLLFAAVLSLPAIGVAAAASAVRRRMDAAAR